MTKIKAAIAPFAAVQATTCATPSLTRARQITLDAGAEHYAIPGDFNGDGKADLAVYTTLGRIHMLLGDGAGNLTTTASTLFLPTGGARTQVGTGDFNGDGRLDVVLLSTARLELYFNNGNGALTIGNTYAINAASFVTGDFNEDGKTDIVLGLRCCPDGVVMYLSNATGFAVSNPSWGASRMSAVGDFNGDGNLDVLTSDNYYPSSQVRLGNGRGQFTNGEYLYYDVQVFYFAATDFNKDGKVDVLGYTAQNRVGQDIANSRKLIVLSGDGAGRFTASYPTALLDAIRADSVAADFTGDGFPDIATRATDIFVNNGSAGLCPAFPLVNAAVNRVSAADFNGDGKADLIRQAGSVEIWASVGGATNTPPTFTGSVAELTQGILADDFSRIQTIGTVQDAETPAGNLQVSAPNLPGWISFNRLFNENGNILANFTISCGAPIGIANIPITVTDAGGLSTTGFWRVNVVANNPPGFVRYRDVIVNGVGVELYPSAAWFDDSLRVPDLQVSAPGFAGSIEIDQLKNHPNNGAVRIKNNLIPGRYQAIVTAKDNCGATTTSTFFFTIPSTPLSCDERQMSFALPPTHYTTGNAFAIVTGDFNRDGKTDIASANFSDSIAVLLGQGDGKFGGPVNYAAGREPSALGTGDFNSDGRLDMAVGNRSSDSVTILLGNGAGSFGFGGNFAVGRNPQSLSVGDFNRDNRLDLVVGNINSNNVSVLLGNGLGGFSAATNFTVGNTPTDVVVGDFNKDGRDDLAVTNVNSHNVSILLGTGTGGFNTPVNYPVGSSPEAGSSPQAVTTGDFNGDGNLDIAVPNLNSNDVSVLLGNGSGVFSPALNYAVGSFPYSIVAADFNSDGKLDLVCSNIYSYNLSILLGNGRGGFGTASQFGLLERPGAIAVGDFDGNQKPDVATGYVFGSSLSILQNYYTCSTNTPPTLTLEPLTPNQGVTFAPFIGAASDVETPFNLLQVSASNVPAGISLTNLQVDNTGAVKANLQISCTMPLGTYQIPIRVTDSGGLSVTSNLSLTVQANQLPFLGAYPATTVNGSSVQVTPITAPGDDGGTPTVTVAAASYAGSLIIAANGVVTINNNNVAGSYVATVTATDNCGLRSTTTFTFTIPSTPPPTCNVPSFQRGATTTLTPAVDSTFVGLIPGDFNKDGFQDVIAVRANALSQIYFGDGRGGFSLNATKSNMDIPVQAGDIMRTGDFNGDGYLDVGVLRLNALIGTRPQYTSFQTALNDRTGKLSVVGGSTVNGVFYGVELGDVNNDGFTDFVVNTGYNNAVYLNTKTNAFTRLPNEFGFPTKMILAPVIVGYPLALYNEGEGAVYLFQGDGAGNFIRQWGVSVPGNLQAVVTRGISISQLITSSNGQLNIDVPPNTVYSSPVLTPADFNGDGFLDLLLADGRAPIYNPTTYIYCGAADSRAQGLTNPAAAADFNGDGKADILTTTATGFTLWTSGSGGGTTNTPPTITVGPGIFGQGVNTSVTFGNVTDTETPVDNLQLSVTALPAGITLSNLRIINGFIGAELSVGCAVPLGTYQIPVKVTDGGGLSAMANWAVTVNANQPPSIGEYVNTTVSSPSVVITPTRTPADNGTITSMVVRAPSYTGSISITAQGVITIVNNNIAGTYIATVIATDNCGLTASYSFNFTIPSTPTGCATPTFNASQSYSANNRPYGLASGDFNGDGRIDLVTTNLWDNTVTVLLAGANGFTKQLPIIVGVLPNYIVARDLNGDNRLDLTVVNRGSDTVTILLGNGNGTFTKKGDYNVGNKSTGVVIADFNGDSRLDLILPNDGFGNAVILLGNGDGSFGPLRYLLAGTTPQPPVAADFNKDGIIDIAFPNYLSGEVAIMLNRGDGSFLAPILIGNLGGSGVEAIALGDVNGDGNVDLAVTNTTTNQVFTILSDGRGGFTRGSSFATGSNYPASLVVTDFNNDGRADIAVGGYSDNQVRVFRGLANGFDTQSPLVLTVGNDPLSLLTNDFNGDGQPDLAIANQGSGTVSVLLNGCR